MTNKKYFVVKDGVVQSLAKFAKMNGLPMRTAYSRWKILFPETEQIDYEQAFLLTVELKRGPKEKME